MAVADVHDKLVAFLGDLVADALNGKLFLEALGYADDHVAEQGTGQTVEAAVFLVVIGTGNGEDACFLLNLHLGSKVALKSSLGTFNGDVIVFFDFDLNTCGNGNGCSTYS